MLTLKNAIFISHSGICGALLGLSYSRLTELIPIAKIRWISSISMVGIAFSFPHMVCLCVTSRGCSRINAGLNFEMILTNEIQLP